MKLAGRSTDLIKALPIACLLALFLFHWGTLLYYSVDTLHWDEWVVWWSWEGQSFFSWLFSRHNEHILVPTRLEVFLVDRLFGGNHRLLLTLGFFFYGYVLYWFLSLSRRGEVPVSLPIMAAFCVFLLTPLSFENHFLPMDILFHCCLVFPLLAIQFLFRKTSRLGDTLWGLFWLALSVFSASAGVAGALGVASVYAAFESTRAGGWKRAAIVIFPLGACVLVWLLGHHWIPTHPRPGFPWQPRFWDFFLNLLSTGFGQMRVSTLVGGLSFAGLLAVFSAAALLGRWTVGKWKTVAALGLSLALIASISVGRTWAGTGAAKSSRYVEFALLLPILFACALAFAFEHKPRSSTVLTAFFWGLCFFGFWSHWNFAVYEEIHTHLSRGRLCVSNYLKGKGPASCPDIYPDDIRPHLERGKRLRAPLIQRLLSE